MVTNLEEARQCVHRNKIDTSKYSTIIVSETGDIYLDPKREIDGFVVKGEVEKVKKSKEK